MTDATLDDQIDRALAADDRDIGLGEVALLLAHREYPEVDLDTYRDHLARVCAATAAAARGADALPEQVAALNSVIFEDLGYRGDRDTYTALDNTNLIKVIDRRRGIPVSLAIIYLEAARAQGWAADGLNFPGHFLLRMRRRNHAAIVDPFHGGQMLDVDDLRAYLKAVAGNDAELQQDHYTPIGNRGTLMRLQNNLRLRARDNGDLERVALATDAMVKLAPDEINLWYELADLCIVHGALDRALQATEAFEARATSSSHYARGKALRAKLRSKLH